MSQGDRYQLETAPADVICTATSAAGGAVTATTAAPAANQYWLITGVDLTTDGAPTAGIFGGIQLNGIVFYPIRLSANAWSPIAINFLRGLAHGVSGSPTLGQTVGVTMSAIGSTSTQTATLRGVLVQTP